MLIIGCDYHPGFQQFAVVDTETGELNERRLEHREEAESFYRELRGLAASVRAGMEASGQARWFERLLGELQFELWIGDAAEIRAKRVRKQKTDRQDARLLLRLLLEDRFLRIWVPSGENRDLRQLLWHRHRLVQMRVRIMNQLHVVALNEGVRRKKALWRPAGRAELEPLVLTCALNDCVSVTPALRNSSMNAIGSTASTRKWTPGLTPRPSEIRRATVAATTAFIQYSRSLSKVNRWRCATSRDPQRP